MYEDNINLFDFDKLKIYFIIEYTCCYMRFDMNDTQVIFTAFFAIVWGTMSTTLPRWKPFHWPLFFHVKQTRHRVCLSFLVLNVLPIIFYGLTLRILSEKNYVVICWGGLTVFQIILHGVIPAFAVFGFYRLWLAIIEIWPRCFFVKYKFMLSIKYWQSEEPTFDWPIPVPTRYGNLFWALVYIITALLTPHIFR